MSNYELDISNYDYYELLNLFEITHDDAEYCNKLINKRLMEIINEDKNIYSFYKKASIVIYFINQLLHSQAIVASNICDGVAFIYRIPQFENQRINELCQMFTNSNSNSNSNSIINANNNVLVKQQGITRGVIATPNTESTPVFQVSVQDVAPGELNAVKRTTQQINLNLNSCFRTNYFQSSSCNFTYTIPTEIKNVIALRIASIEIPNAWYLISEDKHNNQVDIILHHKHDKHTTHQIIIPSGNYDSNSLMLYLNTTYFYESESPLNCIKFDINTRSLKSSFELLQADTETVISFSLKFSLNISQNIMMTFGWILGFRLGNYEDIETIVLSEGLFDAGGDRYIYIAVNDYQKNTNTSNITGFDGCVLNDDVLSKIPMTNGKLSLIVNDSNCILSKVRKYNGPITLSKLHIKVLDQFGNVIDLNHMDYSISFELQTLYENFNFKNVL